MLRSSRIRLEIPQIYHRRLIASTHLLNKEKSYAYGATSLPLFHHTIGQRLKMAVDQVPDKELFIFKEHNVRKTYHQFYEDAQRLASGLLHLGMKRGDRVGIWGPNYYEWTIAQFATALAGNILVCVNPAYKTDELRYALEKVGMRALITPPKFRSSDYYGTLSEIIPDLPDGKEGEGVIDAPDLPELKHLIIFDHEGKKYPGAWDFGELLSAGGSAEKRELDDLEGRIKPDDPVNIQYTSGTTGNPKAATLTHFSMMNSAFFCGNNLGFDKMETRLCIPNPLYHCFGCGIGTLSIMLHKQTCIFPSPWFDANAVCKAVSEEKCTTLYGTPTMFVDIMAASEFKNSDFSSMRSGIMGGGTCPPSLCQRIVDDMSVGDLLLVYGTTEMSPMITLARTSDPPLERIKHVGYPAEHVEISVVDAQGEVLDRGQPGEILTRGYSVMRGYWGDVEMTRAAITHDRWYHTGDIGIMNDNDSIVICGRVREMIIRGGENIYPSEIEQFLFKHPSIKEVFIVGVPDVRYGEEVCAVIRMKDGAEPLTAHQIKDFCRGKISHYKIPRYVLFKNASFIPLTATGKVKKYRLSELCRDELGLKDLS